MSVTIKDIAKRANVSYATVSRALSDHPEISGETKKKILALASDMGYTPNAIAKGLVTKNTRTLALLIPEISNPFFPELAQGIEDYANTNGYQVFLCNSNWNIQKEKEYLNKLYSSRVDGIVITPVSDDISHIIGSNLKIPMVFAAFRPQNPDISYVAIDDYKASYMAIEYFIKLGHKKIAFAGGLLSNSSQFLRLTAYKDILSKHHLPIDPRYIVHGQFTISSGYNLAKELLMVEELPTAILCGNDIVALGVIQAIEEFGLNVPKDVSVIGFDDIPYASLNKIQLTTVYQPKYEIGGLCIDLLMNKIRNKEAGNDLFHVIEPKLIIRKTCKGI